MSFNGLEIPYLILVQPFLLALLVIDFNGPAVAIDACDPRRLPVQAVGHQEHGFVRQVSLAMVDHQAMFAKVVQAMGSTIAVVPFLTTFERDSDLLEHRSSFFFDSFRDGSLRCDTSEIFVG
jgi:hypothetical protein